MNTDIDDLSIRLNDWVLNFNLEGNDSVSANLLNLKRDLIYTDNVITKWLVNDISISLLQDIKAEFIVKHDFLFSKGQLLFNNNLYVSDYSVFQVWLYNKSNYAFLNNNKSIDSPFVVGYLVYYIYDDVPCYVTLYDKPLRGDDSAYVGRLNLSSSEFGYFKLNKGHVGDTLLLKIKDSFYNFDTL